MMNCSDGGKLQSPTAASAASDVIIVRPRVVARVVHGRRAVALLRPAIAAFAVLILIGPVAEGEAVPRNGTGRGEARARFAFQYLRLRVSREPARVPLPFAHAPVHAAPAETSVAAAGAVVVTAAADQGLGAL